MDIAQATQFIAQELLKEKAKLVILGGSVARGKENPSDLDIAVVFEPENNLLNKGYRKRLIQRLEEAVGYKLDLIDYNEQLINSLVENYREDARKTCYELNYICMDNVKDQWMGWPLAWIFGEKAKERLDPYLCFQEEFQILAGEDYLEGLRRRINTPL